MGNREGRREETAFEKEFGDNRFEREMAMQLAKVRATVITLTLSKPTQTIFKPTKNDKVLFLKAIYLEKQKLIR